MGLKQYDDRGRLERIDLSTFKVEEGRIYVCFDSKKVYFDQDYLLSKFGERLLTNNLYFQGAIDVFDDEELVLVVFSCATYLKLLQERQPTMYKETKVAAFEEFYFNWVPRDKSDMKKRSVRERVELVDLEPFIQHSGEIFISRNTKKVYFDEKFLTNKFGEDVMTDGLYDSTAIDVYDGSFVVKELFSCAAYLELMRESAPEGASIPSLSKIESFYLRMLGVDSFLEAPMELHQEEETVEQRVARVTLLCNHYSEVAFTIAEIKSQLGDDPILKDLILSNFLKDVF